MSRRDATWSLITVCGERAQKISRLMGAFTSFNAPCPPGSAGPIERQAQKCLLWLGPGRIGVGWPRARVWRVLVDYFSLN